MLFDLDEKSQSGMTDSKGNNAFASVVRDVNKEGMNFETILGEKNTITGNIEGSSPICINGKLRGNVDTSSYVYISKTGLVEGDVTANHLVLYGTLTGENVKVGKLDVTATGILNSDITVERLTVEEGGVLNGQISVVTGTKVTSVETPAAPVTPVVSSTPATPATPAAPADHNKK